ncbi:MAG: flagellar basal body P-ring formation protein FlgA [Bacteriovoracaceae bacterium]|nr:flagellar basal body P-ring formation protein FlgA [Bacteriovoracaceae bacterium]
MKITLFFMFLFVVVPANAAGICHIKSSAKIVIVDGDRLSFNDIATAENCKDKSKIKFLEVISSSNGTLRSSMVKKEFPENIKITPRRIQISTMRQTLGNHFETFNKWVWTDIKFLAGKSAIKMNQNERLEFSCDFCKTLGSKSINLIIVDPIKSSNRTEWFKASLKVETMAIVPKTDLQISNDGITPSQFESTRVLTTKPESYFTNKEKLVFYKLTRPLPKGEPLKFNHITPSNLVRQGRAATVILKNKTMNLSGKAIPLGNGKFGEMIQLRNPRSKKVLVGKVVDYNKVVIEL